MPIWPSPLAARRRGGAAALAARARERLAQGKPLEALHLVDIALRAYPVCRPALEAKCDCNQEGEI